jgi:hypothetical protein
MEENAVIEGVSNSLFLGKNPVCENVAGGLNGKA